eukprot:471328_1
MQPQQMKQLPLHLFSVEDLCNTIEHWVVNDINYQKNHQKLQTLFVQHIAPHMPTYYFPSYCNGMYGSYTCIDTSLNYMPMHYAPANSTGAYGSYCCQYYSHTKQNYRASNSTGIYGSYNYEKKTVKYIKSNYISWNYNSINNNRQIKNQMLKFMTRDTMYIVLKYFKQLLRNNLNSIRSKSRKEIASILYKYPLNKLILKIKSQQINGTKLINILKDENFISNATGWRVSESKQIELYLYKHISRTKKQFTENMNIILATKEFESEMKNKIRKILTDDQFNIDIINYKIINNMNITQFTDKLADMIDDMVDDEKEDDNDIVPKVYNIIAHCFLENNITTDNKLQLLQHWTCSNCANYNFVKCIAGAMKYDISICISCGISRIQSIILKLRNHDTFTMVQINDSQSNKDTNSDTKDDSKQDVIKQAIKQDIFDIICPNKHTNEQCESMIRLCNILIQYKNWLKQCRNTDINQSAKLNIKNTTKDNFKTAFIKSINLPSLKISNDDIKQFNAMLMRSKHYIDGKDMQSLYNLGKKRFAKKISEHIKINVNRKTAGKLYKYIEQELKHLMETTQAGELFSDVKMTSAQKDYNHILTWHIEKGNESTIKNVFRFFAHVVHFDDTSQEIERCICIKRQKKREKSKNEIKKVQQNNVPSNINIRHDKNMWEEKQYYYQHTLDVYHNYLVHSNWKSHVEKHLNLDDLNQDKYLSEFS